MRSVRSVYSCGNVHSLVWQPKLSAKAKNAGAAQKTGVARDHAATGAGQDNFKGCNHFPSTGHVGKLRFERGLPPGYAGYLPDHHTPELDPLQFKIGAVTRPPVRYSPDRVPPPRPVEAWSSGGLHHRRDSEVVQIM